MAIDIPTAAEQTAQAIATAAKLRADLETAMDWLRLHWRGDLPAARLTGVVGRDGVLNRLDIQCSNADQLAACTHVLSAGGGKGGVRKNFVTYKHDDPYTPGRLDLIRRFGLVEIRAWLAGDPDELRKTPVLAGAGA